MQDSFLVAGVHSVEETEVGDLVSRSQSEVTRPATAREADLQGA